MNYTVHGAHTLEADRVWRLSGFGAAELADNARAAANGAVTGVLALAGFVVLALWLTVGLAVQRDQATETRQARASLNHLALAVAEHTGKTLGQADQLARQVRSDWRRLNGRLDLTAALKAQAPAGSPLVQVSVLGSDGQLLASSQVVPARADTRTDARPDTRSAATDAREAQASRDQFLALARAGLGDTPYLSRTQLDGASRQWVMQLGRRIEDADGRYAGLVIVSVLPAFTSHFFGDVDLGQQGLIALVGFDGQVRARAAAGTQLTGQDQSASALFRDMVEHRTGDMRSVSPVDGIERLHAYRALDDYRVFAVAARSVEEIYADSRLRSQTWLAVGGLMTVVIAVLTLHVLRRARQQAELLQALSLSRQKADLANDMRSRFLLDLADGLREPMRIILERAEALRDTHADPRARAQGRQIHEAAQRMCDRFSTMFESSAPAPLDAMALASAAIEQASGGLKVDTASAAPGGSMGPGSRCPAAPLARSHHHSPQRTGGSSAAATTPRR
ncbi:MAG: hypothetical protein RLZZ584_3665 [Pseudomonadota bacterium]|jgi:signal transduction histidine kinase